MKNIIFVSVLALSVAACGDRIKTDDEASGANDAGYSDGSASGATTGTINDGDGMGGAALQGGKLVSYEKNAINDPNNVLSEKIVYFGFDSNAVSDDYIELVKHHGKYLSYNGSASIRLEGHADELGTREYNVALGEERAKSVKQIMLYEGARNDQIKVISYGEEKPVEFGQDDESMSLNRRVELIYD
jgi:peptidoglycan-associated lipoprotein